MGSTICLENRDHQYDDLYDYNFGGRSAIQKNIIINFDVNEMYTKKRRRKKRRRKKVIVR